MTFGFYVCLRGKDALLKQIDTRERMGLGQLKEVHYVPHSMSDSLSHPAYCE